MLFIDWSIPTESGTNGLSHYTSDGRTHCVATSICIAGGVHLSCWLLMEKNVKY